MVAIVVTYSSVIDSHVHNIILFTFKSKVTVK
jgi:hypothetical protein